MSRYLQAITPLRTPKQLEITRAHVHDALAPGSMLRELQRELEAYDATRVASSYVSEAWDRMYLSTRCSLMLNSNPAAVARTSTSFDATTTSQVARAAQMVVAHVAFADKIEAGTLSPDVFHGVPLDMRQYLRMYGATRLPRAGCDVLHKTHGARHIVVLRGGSFWEVPVYDATTGEPLLARAVEASLRAVVDETPAATAPSLAVMTTADRDTWARARAELEAHSAANAASLDAIDGALFHLCLDEASVGTTGGAEPAGGAQIATAERLALCGDPRLAPRWMDKSLTLAVSADGVPMVHFEHSWGDGICVARAGAETWSMVKAKAIAQLRPASAPETVTPPRLLTLEAPPAVKDAATQQEATFAQTCAALDLDITTFTDFGAGELKRWGISPDGAIQAALALAFHRLHRRMPATYESATTAHFLGGRTETIRPSTTACHDWVLAAQEGKPLAEQAKLLKRSAKRHQAVAREAAAGKGFDRHLFALRKLAEARCEASGEPMPSVFTDEAFTHLSGNELSTSTVSLGHTLNSGFGPVHAEGFGIFYFTGGSAKGGMRFCTTAYRPQAASKLNAEIRAALTHVRAVLEADAAAGEDGAAELKAGAKKAL